MDHVEVLLLLHKSAPQEFSTDDIARETTRPQELITAALDDLTKGGLVSRAAGAGGVETFHYEPQSDELRSAAESLVDVYNTKPVTLIRAIYDRPAEPVISFAEAFRVRGGDS